MVVVLRREFDQLEHARIDDGLGVEHFEHGLEFLERQLGARGVRVDDAHPSLASERDANAGAGLRRMRAGARRQVVEQPAQRRVERDAQDCRAGQAGSLRVFHNVCG
jgi:hypothetical protein